MRPLNSDTGAAHHEQQSRMASQGTLHTTAAWTVPMFSYQLAECIAQGRGGVFNVVQSKPG